MNEPMLSTAISQVVQLDAFWTTLASQACPSTQLALAGAARMARDAVLQCAPCTQLTVQLSPGPSPDTLGLLRSSGRTLPATVVINNNNTEPPSARGANHIARLIMLQLSCGAVTSLHLAGGPWLVDTALLTSICTALPGLTKLVLPNVTMPPHLPAAPAAPAAPALAWPSLRTVSISPNGVVADVQPENTVPLLAALGIRAGGGVINLSYGGHPVHDGHHLVMQHMLTSNQMHALRKLSLPGFTISKWGPDEVGGALIRNAPALEHLQVYQLVWFAPDDHGTSAMIVPWRILQVQVLGLNFCCGLPLGISQGQPPLILRVMDCLHGWIIDGDHHFMSPEPGISRRVQLECTRTALSRIRDDGDGFSFGNILRVLTLSTGLSNLILDGIDSADDIKDLAELSTTGVTFIFDEDLMSAGQGRGIVWGLRDLPQVTKVGFKTDQPESWQAMGWQLLAVLPAHITEVRLSGGPGLSLVSRMCVEVSRLPHRQAQPLRLCVPGVAGWLDAAESAIRAAGIARTGVLGMPNTEV